MPIYEYQCTLCSHHLEALQKMTDKPLTECPKCHEAALTKLISAAGFQLKGTGWYATDYKAKSKQSNAGESSSEGGTATKAEDKKSTDSSSNNSGAAS